MSTFLRYQDGFVFEVDEQMVGGERRIASSSGLVQEVNKTLQEAFEKQVRPAAEKLVAALRDISPDEIELEIGIKMAGEVGAIFARCGTDAHMVVKMKWASKNGR